jgi:hypothetical protein
MRAAATIVGNKDFNVITSRARKHLGCLRKRLPREIKGGKQSCQEGKQRVIHGGAGPGDGSNSVLIEPKEHALLDEWLDAFDVRKRAQQRVI